MKRKIKILIVEDEVVVSADLRNQLEKNGYKVGTIVRYGEKVLDTVKQTEPDLILMDIQLKGEMDGIEAAQNVMKHKAIPIIFLTAYADDITLKRAKITKPYAYLKKPIRLEDLKISVEIALHKAKLDNEREKLIQDLKEALSEVKTLRGLLPICSHCKNIRDDSGYWSQIESYITKHSDIEFSHSICKECADKYYPDYDLYEK